MKMVYTQVYNGCVVIKLHTCAPRRRRGENDRVEEQNKPSWTRLSFEMRYGRFKQQLKSGW